MADQTIDSIDSASKPVFLTKKQREQLALEKLNAKRSAEKAALEAAEKKRKEYLEIAQQEREKQEFISKNERFDRKDSNLKRKYRDEAVEKEKTEETEGLNAEMQNIKDLYLGKKKQKKKVIPPSQRFRFVFDWNEEEDTSQDLNPLYKEKHQVSLGFGRGLIGGIDPEEQKSKSSQLYDGLIEKRNFDLEKLKDQKKVKAREERLRRKELEMIGKSKHWSEKTIAEMTDRDWRIFNEDFNITCRGGSIPKPLRSWNEAHLPKALLDNIIKVNYKEPTPIQKAAIPIGLQNRDLMGIAETGSGKTAAFVIPLLAYVLQQPKMTQELSQDGPYALVLAPTRELVHQINSEVEKLAAGLGIRSVVFIGGTAAENQGFLMSHGAEIVIATPGRMIANVKKKFVVLNQCRYVVLDEADRMIELNFEEQVIEIMDSMPSSNLRPENPEEEDIHHQYRQTFMFSATMPTKVGLLAAKYLRNPAYVAIGDRTGKVADTIEQKALWMTEGQKQRKLRDIIQNHKPPIIVFSNEKKNCDIIARYLILEGYSPAVLHSGKSQELRERALEGFKSGVHDVLVATDVAGRGLDIKGVTLVINYDMPKNMEVYMHRIGRTGRAGMEGKAISFVTAQDGDIIVELKQVLLQSGADIPLEMERFKPEDSIGKGKSSQIIFK